MADVGGEKWAFVDEYGTPSLDTDTKDVGKFFIVAAVVLDGEALAPTREALERVRQKHFQTGEMKSSKLGSDRARWVRVLTDLAAVPFRFYALAVDKREINKTSGLRWKGSFYKHLCGRVYGKLMRAHPALRVRADQYGRDEFKESFANYIEANHRPTLFERGTFEFIDGKSDVLIQVADVVCGLLARCYDPDKELSNPSELLGVMARHALVVDEWPPKHALTLGVTEMRELAKADDRIARYALQQAELFIQKHEDSLADDVRCQVAVLERLILERRIGAVGGHVSTSELLEALTFRGYAPKTSTWLRMNVIAPLRDRDVLVASSQAGYNLPASQADLAAYVRHAETICVPMLNRVDAACRAVKLATDGEIDVLGIPELASVRVLVSALEDFPSRSPSFEALEDEDHE
ncbi:MAG: DUF3800 domain-containing protein [Myxococcales bacterium]|nr:DUF3800 domain-containing protein [Myxococcales bacterium]